jgi:hypothetical protein
LIPVYAICVLLGSVGALAWVYLGMTASAVEGKAALDPETRYGFAGRATVAGVLGFGLGGMSASFAGWNSGLAIVGAIGGAGLMIAAAHFLGDATDEDET